MQPAELRVVVLNNLPAEVAVQQPFIDLFQS
jgi:hypothetical protein